MERLTKQKKELRNIINNTTGVFTAEQLNKKTSASTATIYRELKRLVNQGKLHSYQCKGKTIYSKDKKQHAHFNCESCKKTTHIEITDLPIKKTIPGKTCHVQIDITGVCDNCLKKINKTNNNNQNTQWY